MITFKSNKIYIFLNYNECEKLCSKKDEKVFLNYSNKFKLILSNKEVYLYIPNVEIIKIPMEYVWAKEWIINKNLSYDEIVKKLITQSIEKDNFFKDKVLTKEMKEIIETFSNEIIVVNEEEEEEKYIFDELAVLSEEYEKERIKMKFIDNHCSRRFMEETYKSVYQFIFIQGEKLYLYKGVIDEIEEIEFNKDLKVGNFKYLAHFVKKAFKKRIKKKI